MNFAQQSASADEFAQLWQAIMPETPAPGKDQFLLWAGNYSAGQVRTGINGSARKARAMEHVSCPMSADDVARYASSIMKHEAAGLRRHRTGTAK